MKKAQFLLVSCLLLCSALFTTAQKKEVQISQNQNSPAAVVAEREIRDFFNAYAEDLRLHRGEAVAARYDSRGYYRMGNGTKTLVSFEENRKRFVNNWAGPKFFEWKDLSSTLR